MDTLVDALLLRRFSYLSPWLERVRALRSRYLIAPLFPITASVLGLAAGALKGYSLFVILVPVTVVVPRLLYA